MASSNLSFFQSVGGTVGLAITGTVFASSLSRELPASLGAAGLPPEVAGALASGGGAGIAQAIGVGNTGAAILGALPADVRSVVEPYIPAIVSAIHEAFSLATASTFAVGIVTCLAASVLVLAFRESRATAEARSWEPETADPTRSRPWPESSGRAPAELQLGPRRADLRTSVPGVLGGVRHLRVRTLGSLPAAA